MISPGGRVHKSSPYLSVSEMARVHGVSRQTLIHYDRIGLFRPASISENGYRLYAVRQFPALREICLLRQLGVSLEDIKGVMDHHDPTHVMALLRAERDTIDDEITALIRRRDSVDQRLDLYRDVTEKIAAAGVPQLRSYPERHALFAPFLDTEPVGREQLHLTLAPCWNELRRHELLASRGFGTLVRRMRLGSDSPMTGAGSFCIIPAGLDQDHTLFESSNLVVLPEGTYACLSLSHMPFDTRWSDILLPWVAENGLTARSDVFDFCLLDTTSYVNDDDVDFCDVQILV